MYRKYIHTILLVFLITTPFLSPSTGLGQEQESKKDTYVWFDNLVGRTNSGIFTGVRYDNNYRVVNDRHQFFESSDFIAGTVTYNGQSYFDVLLKYDVYFDNLLVRNDELANKPIMVFDKEGVTEFTINDSSFEHLKSSMLPDGVVGFFEVLIKNDSSVLYKKHSKRVFKRTDEQIVYYEFRGGSSYLLFFDGTYYPLKKIKQLNSLFPKYRKEIKVIGKKHSSLKKQNTDAYIKAVVKDVLLLKPTLKPRSI